LKLIYLELVQAAVKVPIIVIFANKL